MNKTDRLLAIVLELQGKGQQRAEDLARTFETCKRTIYRDIQALCEAGVPLMAIPGRGYALMEGYFLPPLSFSVDEATMLLLGSDFMARSFDAHLGAAAVSASRKIAGVLPPKQQADVRDLQSGLLFVVPATARQTGEQEKLRLLRGAIVARTTVQFCYQRRHSAEGMAPETTDPRRADPYGLIHVRAAWYLKAYCHLRRAVRTFRLDRMDALRVVDGTFTRPAHIPSNLGAIDDASVEVRVLFDHAIARWVLEDPPPFITTTTPHAEGLLVTLHVRHEREIVQWLLGWGGQMHVIAPASLRQTIAAEAAALLARHGGE